MPVCRPPCWIAALALAAGCSTTAGIRQDAERRMPIAGPVAEARRSEAAALAGSQAEPAALPQPLPLRDCVTAALGGNRDLRLRLSAAERARLGIVKARSEVYAPQLTASVSRTVERDAAGSVRDDQAEARIAVATNALGFSIAPYASGARSDDEADPDATPYAAAAGIEISRRILAGHEALRLGAPLTRADRAFAQAVNNLSLRTRSLALDASRAFFELQKAEARNRLRQARVEQARASLAGIREAVAAGLKAPVEEINAAIDLNQAEANLLADNLAVANARDRLLDLLGQPLGGALAIVPADVDAAKTDLPPLDADLARVLAGHEDLANLRLDQDQSREDALLARDRLLPQITASASAERSWSGARPGAGTPDDIVALTLALEMPLDAWAGERAAARIAERQLRELRLRLQQRSAELERELRELRRRIEVRTSGVALAGRRLTAERAKFAATEASYRTGGIDNLELTRARDALDRAEVDDMESRIDLVLALAEREALLPPAEAGR